MLHKKAVQDVKQSAKRHEVRAERAASGTHAFPIQDELQAMRKKAKDLSAQVQALQQLRQSGAPPPGAARTSLASDDLSGAPLLIAARADPAQTSRTSSRRRRARVAWRRTWMRCRAS